jgi:WD40 repeat protein/serine/threonine protein kinase
MHADPSKIRALFQAAVEKHTPEQWPAYLDEACADQPALRRRLEALLQGHAIANSLLDAPDGGLGVGTADEQPRTESPGAVIGPYKLLQQIGEGGMGVVYMAEQEQPIRRRVALKIIKPGMDSAQVIARFEAERQALALMDHQNIAKVLDAGTTDSGRPYFVMELVHGVPITQYCDDHHMTPRERLELFLPVCHAIQHAHQKGIIHRDLKPSNVLVCLYDGVAVPKVIDFGIAKATGQQLTERTMFTQFGSLVGTLEYMSPEQAEMSQLGIDTRSDVYSMGVLLYELLTGTTPLERKRVKEAGFDEIRRLIREEEPPKPSTRLSSSGVALAAISAQRHTEPAKLTRQVRGELDWIVMKALEKDRNRRYESANSLGRDVERYLHDEPVEACPPTAGYRLRKFARKHKAGLVTATAFVVLLLVGTAVSAWQAVLAQANENKANAHAAQAERKEQEAKNERDQVRALNEKFRRTLYASDMNLAQHAWDAGGAGLVRNLLERHIPRAGETDLRDFEWHYLNRQCHTELLTLNGGGKGVAYSPDGKRLASASYDSNSKDGMVNVWDAQTGHKLLTLKGHRGSIDGVVFSPDGKLLACAPSGPGAEATVWDGQTGQVLLSLKGAFNCVVFSPDGKRLASPAQDPRTHEDAVKVWDAQTGQELLSLKKSGIDWVVFSPDGKRLATATGDDNTVKVWDAQTGQELLTCKGHTSTIWPVVFSPDGKRLASASNDQTVKVWDAQTGRELLSIKGHRDWDFSVVFSPDGKRLATTDQQIVKVRDAKTGQELLTLKGHSDPVGSVAFSPDGRHLASASEDATVKIWDTHAVPKPLIYQDGATAVASMAFSPDGKRLASGSGVPYGGWEESKPFETKVWNAETGKVLLSLKGHTGQVEGPDGKRLASASGAVLFNWVYSSPGGAKVWDAQTGQELLSLKGGAYSVAFSPDGNRLATGSGGSDSHGKRFPGDVKVWDARTGQEILTLKGHTDAVLSVAFSPDGKRLASASDDQTLKVWDAQTGQELLTLKGHNGRVRSVAFSPDGKRVASASEDKTVRVWDTQTGQGTLTLKGHARYVRNVIFSPNGLRLASVADDKRVKVWDAQTGRELFTFKGNVRSLAFSPDGHRLANGSNDGKVTIWDSTPLPEKP